MFRKYVRFLLDKHLFVLYTKTKNRTTVRNTRSIIYAFTQGGYKKMTINEREKRIQFMRRRRVAKCRMTLLLTSVLVITIGSVICGSIFSSAKNTEEDALQYKYYKSIVIEEGDSLWSIAKEYQPNEYVSTQDYINEIKQLNGLASETIHAGQHLLVIYYDTELH